MSSAGTATLIASSRLDLRPNRPLCAICKTRFGATMTATPPPQSKLRPFELVTRSRKCNTRDERSVGDARLIATEWRLLVSKGAPDSTRGAVRVQERQPLHS